MKDVYITRISKFLPNDPIDNDQMEERLGIIDGKVSKGRRIVLRNNQIKTRYYAIDNDGNITHNNAQLTKEAIELLCDESFTTENIELLSCGTGSPDQILPSHAAMVHGFLKNGNVEINSPSGACCSGMSALKFGYLAIKSGQNTNAVCTGSERASSWMKSDVFKNEIEHLKKLEETPILAFNKDFLRWMLSDGAGAFLLEDQPNGNLPLKIEWMDAYSYAHEIEACMYAGGDKLENGELKPWSEYPSEEWAQKSLFAIKQDVKLLSENILKKAVETLVKVFEKHDDIKPEDITYYLPHISSYYFKDDLYEAMKNRGVEIPWENWFINLSTVGNVGAGSIYIVLEELVNTGKLKKGNKILLSVPESSRFSYSVALLTVC
ncbi:3-oxoacyl-[acyl-carrier-protein] synthase-3 [Aquimarina sp. EL_43]|uniref:beta-ketoacyl-ACP synthase III n=1 Tax=Aquimarina TaxID=290174 RepID=UPI000472059D|nr:MULTISPECIES: beta-ketoacyl-ACP synthase III [Aquimarina]MBG6130139.1 3-oxoacyl-[acyl-carrier-protein] synthase-3 [Aquimarina sp. EL_35]MBG6148919.1 3-oxoacyl-[acyl-carrier-protein] synthase-3 [Aquimarina sp. EL_32]MBG6168707.1 3-oxoacyl-[acyl-carrier-protein] synthase-3 [Aquimarina sp. EL_43]